MLEKEVRDPVVKYAKSKDVLHKRLHFGAGSEVGWPDDLFIFRSGMVLWVEFKAPGKKPREIQVHRLRTLQKYNQPAFFVDTVVDGKALIDRILDAEGHEGIF